jgi:hypothetical protein
MSHEDMSDLHKELCGDSNKRIPQFLGDCDWNLLHEQSIEIKHFVMNQTTLTL